MKILYVGGFRFPHYDAAAARVLNNGRIMSMLGHDVSYISWGGKYHKQDLCDDGKYRHDNMEYVITDEIDCNCSILKRFRSVLTRGRKSIELIRRMPLKPDLIIMYNAGYDFTKAMLKIGKHYGIKIANDITEWYANDELHFYSWIPNWYNMKYYQNHVANKILISSYLTSYYVGSNNVVIPPLCDISESKWNSTITDERIPHFDGLTLIYAGNPAKKDKLHTAINAINRLACEGERIRLLIVGCDKETYLSNYHRLINSGSLHNNIIFIGKVPQPSVPAYYRKADFMLLIRDRTRKNMVGFPTKFAESITAGVPVITTDTSDLSRFIINGNNGFILNETDEIGLYDFFKNHLLTLSSSDINAIKEAANRRKCSFDYNNYSESIRAFFNGIK